MNWAERHPMAMIAVGVAGISVSAILVRYSQAPSVVTAAWRLLWTVGLMSPVMLGKRKEREELSSSMTSIEYHSRPGSDGQLLTKL